MKITDGKGSGLLAGVNNRQRLETSAITASRSFFVSRDDAQTYNWTSSFSTATGEEIIYIKNTSTTKKLYIDLIRVSAVVTGLFEVFEVSGTATGTTITGKNLNLLSGNSATATALGDAAVGGITIGGRIATARVPAGASDTIPFDDTLILGLNDAIAITYTGSTGITDCTIRGFYE